MLSQWFIDAASILVLVGILIWVLGGIRKSLISEIVVISKETDSAGGESMQFHTNLYVTDSQAKQIKRLERLCAYGAQRRAALHAAYQEVVNKAQAELAKK
jgi:hypothetical protein